MNLNKNVKGLHHIGIVVEDVSKAVNDYSNWFNAMKIGEVFTDENQKVIVQFISLFGIRIELIQPLDKTSPVHNFLENNGGGLYHPAFEVINLDLALDDVRKSGGLIISKTKDGWNGMDVAFTYMAGSTNLLIEFVQNQNNGETV